MDTNLKNNFSFTLSGRPCSKKNSRRIFTHGGRGKITNIPSEAYERFKVDALWQLKSIKAAFDDDFVFPILKNVRVVTDFHSKGKLQFDPDNAHTGILDILQDAGVVLNDKQVRCGVYDVHDGYPDWETLVNITIL